jgi:hypothetical protein
MERIQTDWMEIDVSNIRTKRKAIIRGKEVDLFVSPYDIPKAMRATFDEKETTLIIEFKYLNDEPTELRKHNEDITYVFGKISHRIHGIRFNVGKLFNEKSSREITVLDKFRSALNELADKSGLNDAKDNYEVAKDAIRAKEKYFLAMAA